LGGRKGIRPVKTELWGAGVVICLERGEDLHMAQQMPLPLTASCFSKIHIGLPFWYRLTTKYTFYSLQLNIIEQLIMHSEFCCLTIGTLAATYIWLKTELSLHFYFN